jgi:hypothetical protein
VLVHKYESAVNVKIVTIITDNAKWLTYCIPT